VALTKEKMFGKTISSDREIERVQLDLPNQRYKQLFSKIFHYSLLESSMEIASEQESALLMIP